MKEKYKNKKTGIEFEAEKYCLGMEDFWFDRNNNEYTRVKKNETDIPMMLIDKHGFKKYIEVNENKIIVYNKGYKFLFDLDVFLNNYEVVKNDC